MLITTLLQLAFGGIVSAHAHVTVSNFAPVPSSAQGPPIPQSQGYRMEAFGDGAYMVTEGLYQAMFLVASESVIAVDAPPSIGYNMLKAIRSVTDKPISHVVYSHAHADHIGAAFVYGDPMSLTIIAHKDTAQYLALAPDASHRPAPTITFESSYTLRVGNQTLELDYRGPNHEPGNIYIYAPAQKVLMLVDVVYPRWTPYNALGEAENIPGYIRAHNELLTYDFDHYLGGHLNWVGTRKDVEIARDYVHDLFNTTAFAVNLSGQSNSSISLVSVIAPAAAKADPDNLWALNYDYNDIVADYISEQLAGRWNTTLAGLDVYAKSHAIAMVESLRLDFGILGPFAVKPQ